MDDRGLLIRGIAFTLIGLAFFAALAWTKWRRCLTPPERWSVVLAANGVLAGGLSNLMLAGVVPGDAAGARWTGDGAALLLVAATICNVLQAVKNKQDKTTQTASIAGQNAVVLTAAAAPPQAMSVQTTAPFTQAPAESAVQTVRQGRN